MSSPVKLSRFRRRVLRALSKSYPLLSGLFWGGFWMPCILGLEDAGTEIALILSAFALGTLMRRTPHTVVTKFGAWACGSVAFAMYGLLWPAAFFFGSMELPGRKGKYSGTFFTGLIVGALLGAVFDLAPQVLSSVGVFYFIFSRYRRKAVARSQWMMAALALVAVAFEFWIFVYRTPEIFVRPGRSGYPGMDTVTRLSCFGLSKLDNSGILFISRNVAEPKSDFEYKLLADSFVASPGKMVHDRYDLVIVEHLSSAMHSAPRKLLDIVTPGGILVVPQRFCYKLPALQWRTLPAVNADNGYAAAIIDSDMPLEITPETIDENLSSNVQDNIDNEPAILPGAVEGILIGFESTPVPLSALETPSVDLPRWIWGGIMLIILLEVILHNAAIADWYCSVISALIFGVISNILCGVDCNFYGSKWLIFLLIAGALFLELPFKSAFLRILSVISIVMLLCCRQFTAWPPALAALLFSALSFAGAKSRYREKIGQTRWFEFLCLLSFAAGFFAGGILRDAIPTLLISVCAIKLWLQLRS